MNETVETLTTARPDGHLQGVEGEIGAQRSRGLPADNEARGHVDDEGDVDPPRVCLDIGQIGHPETARCLGTELAIDQVCRPSRGLVREGGADDLAAHHTADPQFAHQTLDGAACHLESLSPELGPHLVGSIHPAVLVPDARDLAFELVVAQAPR
jgi:hypothetical protein